MNKRAKHLTQDSGYIKLKDITSGEKNKEIR